MKQLMLVGILGLAGCGTYGERSMDIPGSAGANGLSGVNGINGTNGFNSLVATSRFTSDPSICSAGSGVLINSGLDSNNNNVLDNSEVSNSTVVCDGNAGATGAQGSAGSTGASGHNGTNGSNGSNGVSCTVQAITPSASSPTGGALLTCGLTQVVVYNGAANAAAAMLQIVQQITPCGPNSSPWKEVLLQLAGGLLVGSFSDNSSGLNTRLSDLPDGSYVDTDNSGCNFSVSTSGSTRSVSWSSGSNSYGSWSANTITFPKYQIKKGPPLYMAPFFLHYPF